MLKNGTTSQVAERQQSKSNVINSKPVTFYFYFLFYTLGKILEGILFIIKQNFYST